MKTVIRDIHALWKIFSKISAENGETFEKPKLVTIEDYKPPRSLSQNARLHCMIRALADATGYSESELKDFVKAEYGEKRRVQVGDVDKLVPLSTTEYNRSQMMALIEQVDRLCAENNVYVEDP